MALTLRQRKQLRAAIQRDEEKKRKDHSFLWSLLNKLHIHRPENG